MLKRRASTSGRSLQEYLRLELERISARPSTREVLDRLRVDMAWRDGEVRPSIEDIVEVQRAGRAR